MSTPVWPPILDRYLYKSTLRWRISKVDVVIRVVGTNLLLCCVKDHTSRELVCFPERHVNWGKLGYFNWVRTIDLSTEGTLIPNRIWQQHIQKVSNELAAELRAKGIKGGHVVVPDGYMPVRPEVHNARIGQKKKHQRQPLTPRQRLLPIAGFSEDQVPSHAWIKTRPLETVIADDE